MRRLRRYHEDTTRLEMKSPARHGARHQSSFKMSGKAASLTFDDGCWAGPSSDRATGSADVIRRNPTVGRRQTPWLSTQIR